MNNRVTFVLTSLILILELLFYPGVVEAGQYNSSTYHYKLAVPDTWIEIPKTIITEAQQKVVKDSNNTENEIIFDSAFQKNKSNSSKSLFFLSLFCGSNYQDWATKRRKD